MRVLFLSFLFVSSVFAIDQKRLKLESDLFKLNFQLKSFYTQENPNCVPTDTASCIEAVCRKLDSFECDGKDELKRIAETCKGNYNGGCINQITRRLSSMDTDSWRELEPIIVACRGNYDGSCLDTICRKLGSFDCDTASELIEIARSCAN